jgi:hypothetical protein
MKPLTFTTVRTVGAESVDMEGLFYGLEPTANL